MNLIDYGFSSAEIEKSLTSRTNPALFFPSTPNRSINISAFLLVIHQVAPHTLEHFSFSDAVDEGEKPEIQQQEERPAHEESLCFEQRTNVDNVPQDESFEGYAAELRQCQSKMRNGTYSSIHPHSHNHVPHSSQNNTTQYKATFV